MKNIEVSSKKITWHRVENKMTASQAEAPYLGVIDANGTVEYSEFVRRMMENGCSESELEINRVMTKHEELMKNYVAQNYKVYTPFGLAGVHLTKSFPAQDAPFDPEFNEAIMTIQPNAETRNAAKGVTLEEDKAAAATLKGPKIDSVYTDGKGFGIVVVRKSFSIAGKGLRLDPSKATDKVTLTSCKTGVVTEVANWTCDGEGFRIDAEVRGDLTPGRYTLGVQFVEGDAEQGRQMSAELKVSVEASETPVLAKSPDGLSTVLTLNGKSKLADLGTVPSTSALTMTGDGLARYVGETPFLVWGDGDDERVEIASIAEGAGGAITTTIGSAEVVLPVGTTTCHLTFGDDDAAIDIGPFKVVRVS